MMNILIKAVLLSLYGIIYQEVLALSPCDFEFNGSRAIGHNVLLIPVDYDVTVQEGKDLLLNSGIDVTEDREICVTRKRLDDVIFIGCTSGYSNSIDYKVADDSLTEYKGSWSLNIYNLQSKDSESTYTWKYNDNGDVIGETRIRVFDKKSSDIQVTSYGGRNMSVILELNALNAIDVGFENTEKVVFFFTNVNGSAHDCHVSEGRPSIYPIHCHNVLSINYINVSKTDMPDIYHLTVTTNATNEPHRTAIDFQVQGTQQPEALYPCSFEFIGSHAIGNNVFLIPIDYDVTVEDGNDLILNSGIDVMEDREICITRKRLDDVVVIGCTSWSSNTIDYTVAGHSLTEYKGFWSLNIYNLQSKHNESTYTWKYSDNGDVIGETRVRVFDKKSSNIQVTSYGGRNMSVILELNELNAIDVGFENTEKIFFSFKNINGSAADCQVSEGRPSIYPIHCHNILSINYINVSKRDMQDIYHLTVTTNATNEPRRVAIEFQVEEENYANLNIIRHPSFHGDIAILEWSMEYDILTSTWFFNNAEIEADERHSTVDNGTSGTLTFHSTSEIDNGIYHCQLRVRFGIINCPVADLTVPVTQLGAFDCNYRYTELISVVVLLIVSVMANVFLGYRCFSRKEIKQDMYHL